MSERGDPDSEAVALAKNCSKLVDEDNRMMRVANNRLKGIYETKAKKKKERSKKRSMRSKKEETANNCQGGNALRHPHEPDAKKKRDEDKREKGEDKNFMNKKVMAMMDITSERWIPTESSSPFVKMFYKFSNMDSDDWVNDRKRSIFDPTATTTIIGKAVTEIDSTPETVIAFLFGFCRDQRMQNARERGNILARVVDEAKNMHYNTTAELVEYPWNLSNREFVMNQTWLQIADAGIKIESTKRSYMWCAEVRAASCEATS